MAIPTAEAKLEMIRLAEPTADELRAVDTLAPGDYEVGFQRTNDILDEALEVFQRSSRSSMGIAGDVMIALFTASGDLVNAAAGTYLHAIIQAPLTTAVIPPGMQFAIDNHGLGILEAAAGTAEARPLAAGAMTN